MDSHTVTRKLSSVFVPFRAPLHWSNVFFESLHEEESTGVIPSGPSEPLIYST
jgi:hypothetical protein